MSALPFARRGCLHTDGWAGHRKQEVEVIGETPKRYRIRAVRETKLAGRNRYLKPGETALVPKTALVLL